ncbi:sensor histidine kinase [Streptomyces sedi]|uniref:Sensor-like histidine kinase SenX3 n=1 Tax=Streptomyces sedi TaxID=555059 RepID=A0A5C4VH08_9ACTN|nr:HAMP domain-containing sensor histidine kinase [Streptomyces sedi]TNM34656.1 HAMP domain-containing histidine kinase [Streptomyces sedi]
MRDLPLIALYAAAGAAVAGAVGVGVLAMVRRRSVSVSLAVLIGITVSALLAGTLSVAWAMFLSAHDLAVVVTVNAVGALAATATALLLGRWVTGAHRALQRSARTLGEVGTFTPPTGPMPAELTSLAEQLAAAQDKLAEARERERALESSRRELVAWISHDLRSPLAGLRAMAEALEDGVAEDPDRYHRLIRTEVERLGSLVGDLFELSRIQAGALALSPTRLSVYDLISDAIAGADPLARQSGVVLADHGVEPVPVEVDGKEMHRVLANLLVNAIRHTPPDGTVAVAAARRAETVVLSVTDGCGGIPPDALPRVFDTGWRGSDARTPPAGAGLGLAIVRGIVEAHAGHTGVRNVEGGCRFEVVLPAR